MHKFTFVISVLLVTNFFFDNLQGQEVYPLNWGGDDYAPHVFPDGKTLIFQSKRNAPRAHSNFWVSRLNSKGSWSKREFPLFLAANKKTSVLNTDGFEGGLTIYYQDNQPQEIYFTSVANEKTGRSGSVGLNIYYTRKEIKGKTWTISEQVTVLSSDFNEGSPAISSDGKTLIFSSDRPGSYGNADLWIAYRKSASDGLSWSTPINLGKNINTTANEISPTISADGKVLFFSSDRSDGFGGYDLYYSRANQKQSPDELSRAWQTVYPLPFPYNSSSNDEAPNVNDGENIYFSSDRLVYKGAGQGFFNLYRMPILTALASTKQRQVTFRVVEKKGKEIRDIAAIIEIQGKNTRSLFYSGNAPRQIMPLLQQVYQLRIVARGYQTSEQTLDLRKKKQSSAGRKDPLEKIYVLQPIGNIDLSQQCELQELACLQELRIFFDLNQKKIKPLYRQKILLAADILKLFPRERIRILGHTDTSGEENYNLQLSEQRAQQVKATLVKLGIASSRLDVVGLGSRQPPLDQAEKDKAQFQRRVNFAIISTPR